VVQHFFTAFMSARFSWNQGIARTSQFGGFETETSQRLKPVGFVHARQDVRVALAYVSAVRSFVHTYFLAPHLRKITDSRTEPQANTFLITRWRS
jgi:hypothetical protein